MGTLSMAMDGLLGTSGQNRMERLVARAKAAGLEVVRVDACTRGMDAHTAGRVQALAKEGLFVAVPGEGLRVDWERL
jgi:hypothetical protein